MSPKKKEDEPFIPSRASAYRESRSEEEIRIENELHSRFDSKSDDIPPLSQREREHLTYLEVMAQYNESKIRRTNYRRYGLLFIILSGLVFLVLIFSLETKIEFLALWVITVIYCVVVMIRADYQYEMYKKFLGLSDEFDYYGMDEDSEDEAGEDPGSGRNSEDEAAGAEKPPAAPPQIKTEAPADAESKPGDKDKDKEKEDKKGEEKK